MISNEADHVGRLPVCSAAGEEKKLALSNNMRVGQNPAKFIDKVAQPQNITVAIVTYIPFLGSYYAKSLDLLKVCLDSLRKNTDLPYDLLVFDNASCNEIRQFLLERHHQGQIQFLLLSDKNVGKGGAWNIIFSGAPGEIIAYADSDIYFYPGWLSALVHVLETVPNVGMVTGIPMWSPAEFSTNTLAWANENREAQLEKGQILPWEDYWRHSQSLGKDMKEARQHFEVRQDICLKYQGQQFYVGAGHFQFVARRKVLQSVLPIPSDRPMGQVRALDIAINNNGYLRLSTSQWWVQHLGNDLAGLVENQNGIKKAKRNKKSLSLKMNPWQSPILRKWMLWLHNKTFDFLYRSKAD